MPAHPSVMDFGPTYGSVGGGENVAAYLPLETAVGKRLVLFSHGRGGDVAQMLPAGLSADAGGVYRVARELCRRGYVVAGYSFTGPTHYGSPAAITQTNTDLGIADTAYDVDSSKVAWLCYSMGYTLGANWARRNLAKTAAVVGVAPLTNQDWFRALSPTYAAEQDAAYATWASNGGATYDPIDSVAAMAGVPVQLWAGASDDTIPPGDVTGGVLRYANALAPADVDMHDVAGTHGTVWNNLDPVAVADFIDAGDW